MGWRSSLGGKKWLVVLLALVAVAGIAWLNRAPMLRWYYLRQLATVAPEGRAAWAEQVAELGEAVLPDLLDSLNGQDAQACASAGAALARLARDWGVSDPRTANLVADLHARFTRLSASGREVVLELAMVLSRPGEDQSKSPPPQSPRWRELYRGLIDHGLAEDDEKCRVRALHLLIHSALSQDADLLKRAACLLRDPRAEVRRAALLAVGLAEQVISNDDLLPFLHDADPVVCRLCEAALRKRGLEEGHLKLAWLISAPHAEDRLRVLRHLESAEDLDPGVWLRRLSRDADAAVRFAAMASASTNRVVDLSDRLREMRATDPSPTVRQWAPYFLQRRMR